MKFRGGGATRKTAPDSDLTISHSENKDNLSPKPLKKTSLESFYENRYVILSLTQNLSILIKNIWHFCGQKCRKAAFTMAEVLITLGIIGIVAAMTLPSLIGNYQKKVTATKLKKAYAVLSQAILLSQSDNGESRYWVDESVKITEENLKRYFDIYWAPYLRISTFCDSAKTCGYPDENQTYVKDFYGKTTSLNFWGGNRISLLTEDGMYLLFRSINDSGSGNERFSKQQQIFVDINAGKNPNCLGKDTFLFYIDLDNPRILPYGYDKDDRTINEKCYGKITNNYLNMCAARIMHDNWEITYY